MLDNVLRRKTRLGYTFSAYKIFGSHTDTQCDYQEKHISNFRTRTQALRSRMPLETVQSGPAGNIYRQLDKKLHRKSTRRRLVRYGILGINALLLFGVMGFVVLGQRSGNASSASVLAAAEETGAIANPLDTVSSADIAVNIARMSNLQESPKIAEDADSVEVELSMPPPDSSVVSKPQVVATALKSKKDIQKYVSVSGDTVTTIAAKFNVTSDSIRWSNNLVANSVNAGQTLWIPPTGNSGIVYVVKAGDTPDSLAGKYKASKDEIIATNDAELTPLKVGERILIPGGVQPAPIVSARVANAGFGWGSAPVYGNNLYTFGYCTWYIAEKMSVPNNWGNANTWDERAAQSGWIVSKIPRVGSVGQSNRGAEGHVAVVEEVSPDGTMIKYSDMNGLAGWGRVGRSPNWVASTRFDNYIYQ